MRRYYVTFTESGTGMEVFSPIKFSSWAEAQMYAKDYNASNQDFTWNCVVAHVISI